MHLNVWKKLFEDPWFISGTVLALIITILVIAGPRLTLHDPHDMSFQPLSSPSSQHWLGVNDGGMDIFAELLSGLGNTLAFGLFTGITALVIGVVIGLVCAWYGGLTDNFLMRLSDILLAVPSVMILILAAAFFRPSTASLSLLLSAMAWPTTAKAIRAQAQEALEKMGLNPSLSRRFPHELNGGEIQRSILAMALIMDPGVLVHCTS